MSVHRHVTKDTESGSTDDNEMKRKEKTMPFGVNLMGSQVSYQAAQTDDNDMLLDFAVHM